MDPLVTLRDGTIKQVNPFTGTQVWTVPGRGNRPLSSPPQVIHPLDDTANVTTCAFCTGRYLDDTPEKDRSTWRADHWHREAGLTLPDVLAETADFRRVPNLFEIMSVDYWQANHRYELSDEALQRWRQYDAAPGGRDQLLRLIRTRLGARADSMTSTDLLEQTGDFFGSAHDVLIARRHFIDGAITDDQLASAGTLTPHEHREYLDLTVDAIVDLTRSNRAIRNVVVFQNWLKPAGASFDHLHKQLVGIDETGVQTAAQLTAVTSEPNAFNDRVLNVALDHRLVVAQNDHAVAIAGFGHRHPTLEVWSTSETRAPWLMEAAERHAFADLVHAMHAATGAAVPCNEEWHHQPPRTTVGMPWHVLLKWRISTPAGFEGGSNIYLNTISPYTVRDRVLPTLHDLRGLGLLAAGVLIGDECDVPRNPIPT